ncbi:MAG: hypothetical protein HQM08_01205 [Candidatus Riflebacteria bacterium]|nr:hypothetical protein [Candidatus Riflebacteria bacterium]
MAKRNGMVFYLIIFVLMVISILSIQFHRVAIQALAQTSRFEQGELLRQVTHAGYEEAFARFNFETNDSSSESSLWLIQRSFPTRNNPVPGTILQAQTIFRNATKVEIESRLRLVDFRSKNFDGFPYSIDPREGIGTIEFKIDTKIFRRDGKILQCTLIKHHDYKILTLVSPRNNDSQRTGFSHFFVNDYVLFVRTGAKEFSDSSGESLNNSRVNLQIDQDSLPKEKRGKIFFGGTQTGPSRSLNTSPNFVYLNLPDNFIPLIPKIASNSQKIEISNSECLQLFPFLVNERQRAYERAEQEIPAGIGHDSAVSQAKAQINDSFSKIKGYFKLGVAPITRTSYSEPQEIFERDIIQYLSPNVANGFSLISKDINKLSEPSFAESIIEGDIRQRFLFHSGCWLDLSEVPNITQEQINSIASISNGAKCVIPGPDSSDPNVVAFYNVLPSIASNKYPRPISALVASFPFKPYPDFLATVSNCPFPNPNFFSPHGDILGSLNIGGKNGFRPFSAATLLASRFANLESFLADSGIINAQKNIEVRGGVQILGSGQLILGDPSRQVQLKGQGIIFANRIFIEGSIRKTNPSDLLILFAFEELRVNTSDQVDAVLVSINDDRNGRVIPERPLNLFGALITDRLSTQNWGSGNHQIKYDPLLKSPTETLYKINILRWMNFFRVTESES